MEIRVDFSPAEHDRIWAAVSGIPQLKAEGATQEEALARLLPAVKAHFHAKIGSIQFSLEEETGPETMPAGLSADKLRALAERYPPPASWYEETEEVL